jgi:hypothetical protein
MGSSGNSIENYGCAMVSSAMLLNYYGIYTDPGTLNNWLSSNGGYDSAGNLYWRKIGNIDGGNIHYKESLSWTGDIYTDNDNWTGLHSQVVEGYPVIVKVDAYLSTPELDGHWVLVTFFGGGDVDDPKNYYINDPDDEIFNPEKTLDFYHDDRYDNTFFAMRVYHGEKFQIGDKIKTISSLDVMKNPDMGSSEISDPDYQGSAQEGTLGEVIEGPVGSDGYLWWKISFEAGKYTGWSIQDVLEIFEDNLAIHPKHGWDSKKLFYPTVSKLGDAKFSLGVGNRRDMWYLVDVYERRTGGVWKLMDPQPFTNPYLSPFGYKETDSYTPKIGREMKIVVKNNPNDEVLLSLLCFDITTRSLFGTSLPIDDSELQDLLVDIITFRRDHLNIGYLLLKGEYGEAVKKVGVKFGEEAAQRALAKILEKVGIQVSTSMIATRAFMLGFGLLTHIPIHYDLIDNINEDPAREEIIFEQRIIPPSEGAEPIITRGLELTPMGPYYVGDKLEASFQITNQGAESITFSTLTLGGRLVASGEVRDFSHHNLVTLSPGESYNYVGEFIPLEEGSYHFFIAYQTPDGEWNTCVPSGGLRRTWDITVSPNPTPSQMPEDTEVDLTPPKIILGHPSGGEVFAGGSTQTISYSVKDNVGVASLDLYYTLDGGGGLFKLEP